MSAIALAGLPLCGPRDFAEGLSPSTSAAYRFLQCTLNTEAFRLHLVGFVGISLFGFAGTSHPFERDLLASASVPNICLIYSFGFCWASTVICTDYFFVVPNIFHLFGFCGCTEHLGFIHIFLLSFAVLIDLVSALLLQLDLTGFLVTHTSNSIQFGSTNFIWNWDCTGRRFLQFDFD